MLQCDTLHLKLKYTLVRLLFTGYGDIRVFLTSQRGLWVSEQRCRLQLFWCLCGSDQNEGPFYWQSHNCRKLEWPENRHNSFKSLNILFKSKRWMCTEACEFLFKDTHFSVFGWTELQSICIIDKASMSLHTWERH